MTNFEQISQELGNLALKHKIVFTTAESCTAGLISSTIAMTPGSSKWLDRSFVVYTPSAKNEMLNVSYETILNHNITSTQVSNEMALGALKKSNANFAIAVTGVAGPSGGTPDIPVGTVCISWIYKKENILIFEEKVLFYGNRNQIREGVVDYSLLKAIKIIKDKNAI